MTKTALALIHSDSDSEVTNEISDYPRIAIASVVKEHGPTLPQKHVSLEKVALFQQLFMY